MAIKLVATYSKKIGLPGYSSHQFSVCLETEIGSVADVAEESSRLYQTLQQSVDEEIQHAGYIPAVGGQNGQTNGHKPNGNGNGAHARNGSRNGNNGHNHVNGSSFLGKWACSQKQQDLILKLVDDNQLSKEGIEKHAHEMFGKGVKELDSKDASVLIKWVLELVTTKTGRQRRPATSYRE